MRVPLFIIIVIVLVLLGLMFFTHEKGQEAQSTTPITAQKSAFGIDRGTSTRKIQITDGLTHSIPLEEIKTGALRDAIPAISNPKFTDTARANEWLDENDIGIGVVLQNEAHFYPYDILVWHEIVNDEIAGTPLLVTYCPLCATGIVFERNAAGVVYEFGVSGKLWQSNLLMYNRTGDEKTESLWSQVLGEAVVGPETGVRLRIIPSMITRYGDFAEKYPDTRVLSRDTGSTRRYGGDPYGDYYTNDEVWFGADARNMALHPKTLVHGIEVNGAYKAYPDNNLSIGATTDTLQEQLIEIRKSEIGAVEFLIGDNVVPHVTAFWFSWVAVHPETELFSR